MKEDLNKVSKALVAALANTNPCTAPVHAFFNELLMESWKKRIEEWLQTIEEKLRNIDESFIEKMKTNKDFASLFLSIQKEALLDYEEEKIPFYINVLKKSIEKEDVSNTKKKIFLNLLKESTHLHLLLLRALNHESKTFYDDSSYPKKYTDFFFSLNPEIKVSKELIQIVLLDLRNKSLVNLRNMEEELVFDPLSHTFHSEKRTTEWGQEFLDFIL